MGVAVGEVLPLRSVCPLDASGLPRPPPGKVLAVNRFLNAIVTWLRAGYPDGVPQNDYLPLLALLSRRLTADEVKAVAGELMSRQDFDHYDIGAEIMKITDELPATDDVERVRERLIAKGWPLDDPRDETDQADPPNRDEAGE